MKARNRRRGLGLLVGLAALAGCAEPAAHPSREPWTPSRHGYAEFQTRHRDVIDPNYLPFMAHRFSFEDSAEDVLVLCRWDQSQLPLAVHVEPPVISDEIQDEFYPATPDRYVEAVERALASWERALGGIVRFRRVDRAGEAVLRLRLVGAVGPAPEPSVQVLGTTRVARACRVPGAGPDSGPLRVHFEVPEIEIYLADQFGLLLPDQVKRVALHEIGHALGMRGHSPIPADLMYEIARDRTVDRLSQEDINSFVSLYRLPNGTVYGRVPRDSGPPEPAEPASDVHPSGPPVLDPSPHVDRDLGYAIRLPKGWTRIATPRGVVTVDGVSWDYEASFQLMVRRYPTISSYLDRHLDAHLGEGTILDQGPLALSRHSAFRVVVAQRGGELVEEHTFIETGDGRLLVAIADCPSELRESFSPWFAAILGSLEIVSAASPASGVQPSAEGGAP